MKIISIITMLVTGMSLLCCTSKKANNAITVVPNVQIVYPQKSTVSDTLAASGMITSTDQSDLSFKTGGTIEQVFAAEGSFVHKGQLLARMNTAELHSQLKQAEYKLTQYRRDLLRFKVLVKDTLATLEQLQNTQTSVATAKAQKDAIVYNLQQTSIYASSGGIILKKLVNPGEYKSSGAVVFTLGSNDHEQHWVFRISVTDKDRIKLKLHQKTKISLDALPGKEFTGTIFRLAMVPDAVTLTYDCYISFDPGKEPVVYGLSGRVSLPQTSERSYTTLPLEAVTQINNGSGMIYTVSGKSIVSKRKITYSSINRDKVVLSSPISTTEKVIMAGKNTIEAGQKVNIENSVL